MKKFRILFTLRGQRLETITHAPSQLRALMIAKAQFPEGSNFNAIEIS